jgi:hypothetical protein
MNCRKEKKKDWTKREKIFNKDKTILIKEKKKLRPEKRNAERRRKRKRNSYKVNIKDCNLFKRASLKIATNLRGISL